MFLSDRYGRFFWVAVSKKGPFGHVREAVTRKRFGRNTISRGYGPPWVRTFGCRCDRRGRVETREGAYPPNRLEATFGHDGGRGGGAGGGLPPPAHLGARAALLWPRAVRGEPKVARPTRASAGGAPRWWPFSWVWGFRGPFRGGHCRVTVLCEQDLARFGTRTGGYFERVVHSARFGRNPRGPTPSKSA